MVNDSVDVTSSGRSFHVCWPAIGKSSATIMLPTVDSLLVAIDCLVSKKIKWNGDVNSCVYAVVYKQSCIYRHWM